MFCFLSVKVLSFLFQKPMTQNNKIDFLMFLVISNFLGGEWCCQSFYVVVYLTSLCAYGCPCFTQFFISLFLIWECTSLNCIRYLISQWYAVTASHFNHRLKLSYDALHLCCEHEFPFTCLLPFNFQFRKFTSLKCIRILNCMLCCFIFKQRSNLSLLLYIFAHECNLSLCNFISV